MGSRRIYKGEHCNVKNRGRRPERVRPEKEFDEIAIQCVLL
jgi:hypothetical protein